MSFSQIYLILSTNFFHNANKVIVLLCVFSICTMCWLYFNISAGLGQFSNRHVYITNVQRWNKLLNESRAMVWPRIVSEPDDRVLVQLKFMDYYGSLPANRTMKHILRVGSFNFEGLREGPYNFDTCPVRECTISSNESVSHLADALLISEMSIFNWLHYVPKPPDQLWIAQHWESAEHDRIDTSLVRRYINWTVSYRRDSTIAISYGKYFHTSNADSSQEIVDYSDGKIKQVAWLVSNCRAKNNRLEYAHELAKYIDVDIYGACGTVKCNRTGPESCHNLLVKQYRFFLAFENSNCKDYITEKLYHAAMQHNVIPIVMGARPEDYAASAPSGSYIHVNSFSGPRELAQYLNVLAADPKLYNKYFEWKKTWSQINDRFWCRLCMMLHLREDIGYFTWYEDYSRWWNSVCGTSCLRHSSLITFVNVAATILAINTLFFYADNYGIMVDDLLIACNI